MKISTAICVVGKRLLCSNCRVGGAGSPIEIIDDADNGEDLRSPSASKDGPYAESFTLSLDRHSGVGFRAADFPHGIHRRSRAHGASLSHSQLC